MNPLTTTPKQMIALGVIVLGITFVLAYKWLNTTTLTDMDLTQFTGTVTEARVYNGNNDYLEIKLSDQPYPFHCFTHLYPSKFNQEVLRLLGPGAPVSVGVASSEAGSPRRPLLNQPFYEFLTMKIAGQEALTITAYNKSVESDRRFGPWVCIAMGIMSFFLIRIGFCYRDSSEPITKILSPPTAP